MKKGISLLLIALVVLMGCSTMVAIHTLPEKAKITINDQPMGPNETLSNFDFNDYNVKISADGYKTLNTSLKKEVKVGALVLGLLLWWPELLWVYGPSANQSFELEASK